MSEHDRATIESRGERGPSGPARYPPRPLLDRKKPPDFDAYFH